MLDNYPNLVNILLGILVLVIDLVITYLIINRVVSNREKNKWKPFRKHFFRSLLKSTSEFKEYNEFMFKDMQTLEFEAMNAKKTDKLKSIKMLKQRILDDYSWYQHSSNKIYNSIQTAGQSISHITSQEFDVLFKYLDTTPSIISEIGLRAYNIEKELTLRLENGEEIISLFKLLSHKREESQRLINQSFGNYLQAITDMSNREKVSIENGDIKYQ